MVPDGADGFTTPLAGSFAPRLQITNVSFVLILDPEFIYITVKTVNVKSKVRNSAHLLHRAVQHTALPRDRKKTDLYRVKSEGVAVDFLVHFVFPSLSESLSHPCLITPSRTHIHLRSFLCSTGY